MPYGDLPSTDIHLRSKYTNEVVTIVRSKYADDSIALFCVDKDTGEPICTPSVCLRGYGITPREGYVFIKDYSENEGMVDALVAAEVIEKPEIFHDGFPMAKLIHPALINL